MAPLAVALVAVRVWLGRREAGRRALPAAEMPGIGPAPAPTAPIAATRRSAREPIDIVTVVDDLLLAGRS